MITYKSKCPQIKLVKEKSEFYSAKLKSSKEVGDFCRNFFKDDLGLYESMFLLLLNQANNTIGWVKISQGGVTGTVCDPIIIAKYAIEALAKNVILCHNHPSGNLTPSQADMTLTKKVSTGLSFFDIKVLDHIILTEEDFYSFADNGIM